MTAANAPTRKISLNDLGLRYLRNIQHLSDLTAYGWAGARTVSEQGYDEVARGVPGLPSTQFRLPFEVVKQESDRAWLKYTLSELIGLIFVYLDDLRKVSGLVFFNAAKARGDGDLATLAAELNKAPEDVDLPSRLKDLKERFGITTELEPHLVSLTRFARLLIQNGGVVPKGESLRLRVRKLVPPASADAKPTLQDWEICWKSEDRVALGRNDHAAIFTTVSLFISATLGAVQELAKRQGLGDEEPAAQ